MDTNVGGTAIRTYLRIFGAAMAIALAALPLSAQAIVIGAPGTGGNCFPFGCSGTRYQQVYDDAAFAGPITISEIRFFRFGTPSTLSSGTYTLRLSHSVNPVDALDTTTFANNVGGDDTLFGVFVVGGPAGATLDFAGTPFVYDGVGDLLLDISIAGIVGGSASFDARNDTAGGVFSRAHDFGSGFANYGLVTEFVPGVPGEAVPAPATLLLLGIGLAALRFTRRFRAAT